MKLKYETSITLAQIRAHGPCASGWKKLCTSLGKTGEDDTVLDIAAVLASNGILDALWCFGCIDTEKLFAAFKEKCKAHNAYADAYARANAYAYADARASALAFMTTALAELLAEQS